MCHQAQIYGWLFNCYCFFVLSLQPTLFSVSIFYSVFIPALLQGFTEKTEIQFAIIISLCLSLATLGRHCVCVCVSVCEFALGDESNWKRVSRMKCLNSLSVYCIFRVLAKVKAHQQTSCFSILCWIFISLSTFSTLMLFEWSKLKTTTVVSQP